jgi:hypothetical protein
MSMERVILVIFGAASVRPPLLLSDRDWKQLARFLKKPLAPWPLLHSELVGYKYKTIKEGGIIAIHMLSMNVSLQVLH